MFFCCGPPLGYALALLIVCVQASSRPKTLPRTSSGAFEAHTPTNRSPKPRLPELSLALSGASASASASVPASSVSVSPVHSPEHHPPPLVVDSSAASTAPVFVSLSALERGDEKDEKESKEQTDKDKDDRESTRAALRRLNSRDSRSVCFGGNFRCWSLFELGSRVRIHGPLNGWISFSVVIPFAAIFADLLHMLGMYWSLRSFCLQSSVRNSVAASFVDFQ